MAENYLITGYWGEPHVTVENDRGFNAAVFGTGKFVLPVGEMFRAEYIGNNTIRIYDGKLIDNGAIAGIPAGEYVEFTIPEAGQGMKRNDLIIFEYSRNDSTLVESGVFKVLSGAEASETAVDPALTENNLLSNIASFDQMALWRVSVNGASISAPEILYNTKFAGERIATANSTDGKAYTVNLPGVAKLYTGLEIVIIPDTASTTTLPTLNVNGLGAMHLKRRITSNTLTTVQSENEEFLCKDQPIRVIYNGKVWVMDMARANAADIYGTIAVENGGTGSKKPEEACANIGAIHTSKIGAENGVASLDSEKRLTPSQFPTTTSGSGSFVYNNVKSVSKSTIIWKKSGHFVLLYVDVDFKATADNDLIRFKIGGLPTSKSISEIALATVNKFIVGVTEKSYALTANARGENTSNYGTCVNLEFLNVDEHTTIQADSSLSITATVLIMVDDL